MRTTRRMWKGWPPGVPKSERHSHARSNQQKNALGEALSCLHVGEGDVAASASLRNATSQADGAADSLAFPITQRILTNPSDSFRSANVHINLTRVGSYG